MAGTREIEADVKQWVHGCCYAAALALHRETGWPMAGLTAIRSVDRGPQMAHAWVVAPDGSFWDAGGKFTPEELEETFLSTEKESTRATAVCEYFDDEAAYMDRHWELAGDFWDECRKWFERTMPKAEAVVRDVVMPRYPELAAAKDEEVFPEPF